ncbi:hypothetical protein MIR68_009419 [Amoeboaphelidium protococcarum]|nr:hypothetical protein MIR68_009419 [Amoeboaphelidium protococcarum]
MMHLVSSRHCQQQQPPSCVTVTRPSVGDGKQRQVVLDGGSYGQFGNGRSLASKKSLITAPPSPIATPPAQQQQQQQQLQYHVKVHGMPFSQLIDMPLSLIMKYTCMSIIGSGGSGKVYKAIRNTDGMKVAIKCIPRNKVPDHRMVIDPTLVAGQQSIVPIEVYILRRLNHPNVIQLVDYICDSNAHYIVMEHFGHQWSSSHGGTQSNGAQFQTKQQQQQQQQQSNNKVDDIRPGDLFECIEQRGPLTEQVAAYVMRQVHDACVYLKSMNVYHMDLKDENISIDQNYHVKIIDFGSALILPAVTEQKLTRFYGTLKYAPPEVLLGQAYSPDKAEAWCLGVILYTCLNGHPPFKTPVDTLNREYHSPRKDLSLPILRLLSGLLNKDPALRWTIQMAGSILSATSSAGIVSGASYISSIKCGL